MRFPIPAFLLLTILVSVASTALASGAAPRAASRAVPARHPLLSWRPVAWRPPSAPTIAAGVRVEIDPVTGELVTADAARFREAAIPRVDRYAGAEWITRSDGSRAVRLNGTLRKWSVASIGPDGELRHECVDSEAEAIGRARDRAASPDARGER